MIWVVMLINRIFLYLISLVLLGCSSSEYFSSKSSKEIWSKIKESNFVFIDFSDFGGNKWTKVCFLGPYNENSEKALGFKWQVSEFTDVLKSDGHNVILFATNTKVSKYVVQPRSKGDFWKVSGKCFYRESSIFVRDKGNGSRKNYIPKKASTRPGT